MISDNGRQKRLAANIALRNAEASNVPTKGLAPARRGHTDNARHAADGKNLITIRKCSLRKRNNRLARNGPWGR